MTGKADYSGFQGFLSGLRSRALASNIEPRIFDSIMQLDSPFPGVLAKQAGQAEFSLSLHDYFARVVSELRIRKGRAELRKRRDLFIGIEARYGVEAKFITAIWGIETDFGRLRGTIPTIPALATLAWKGRRAPFFEEELIAALKIVQDGQATPARMRGSWAGAMGHGQFMPTSIRDFAVDFDGDGRADIWADDPCDGLASIANFLAKHGWTYGQPWGLEVVLPEGFDYMLSGSNRPRPLADWLAMGLTLTDGSHPADYGPSQVLLAAGVHGPAFLVFNNFQVLMRYNRARAYALAAGFLANRIAGEKAPLNPWPDIPALTRNEMRELQKALSAAGFSAGKSDGIFGPDTEKAIRAYQAAAGLPADGTASHTLLTGLKAQRKPAG